MIGNPYAPDLGSGRTDQLRALQTEAELIRDIAGGRSGDCRRQRRGAARTSAGGECQRHRAVELPGGHPLLHGGKPAVATAGAQAFADAYLQYRGVRAAEANAAQAERLRANLEANAAVIDETERRLEDAPTGSATQLQLQEQLPCYAEQQAELQLALTEAIGTVPPSGEVISPASAASPHRVCRRGW